MKTNRRIVDPEMREESRQPTHTSMEAFEAMLYIPVSLAQLELALRGGDVNAQIDDRHGTMKNDNDKLYSQVA